MRIIKTHTLTRPANNYVIDAPQPSNINYWWNVGSLLGLSLVIQIITGVTLAMHYNASVLEAFNSVEHIMRDVNNGWLIRYLHANTASAFFFLVYLHIGRGLYYGSYKAPRTLTWTIGTIMLVLMMATAFLGYVLPYGQMSLWGATVITNLLSAIPWIGQDIVEFVWGGFSVNNATLNRFFSLHFVLPFILAALVLMHLIALHDTAGANNPLGISGNYDRIPFAPYFVFKDFITVFIFMLVLSIFVFFVPNVLGDSENYVMANPMQTPPAIVPEWYLLPFYAILRSIPNKLVGVIAMFSAILIILSLTIGDVSKLRGSQFKPLLKGLFFLFIGNLLLLLVLGAKHVESPFIEAGQIATLIYFVYFGIIVPISATFENSINETYTSIKSMLFNLKGKLNNSAPNPINGGIGLESNLGNGTSSGSKDIPSGNNGAGGNPNGGGNGSWDNIPGSPDSGTADNTIPSGNYPEVVPTGRGADQLTPEQYAEMMREQSASNEMRRRLGLNTIENDGLTGEWTREYIENLSSSQNPENTQPAQDGSQGNSQGGYQENYQGGPQGNSNQGSNNNNNNNNQNPTNGTGDDDSRRKSLKRKRDDDDNEPKGPGGGAGSANGSGSNAGNPNGSGGVQANRTIESESNIIFYLGIVCFSAALIITVFTLMDSAIIIRMISSLINNLISKIYLLNDAPAPWGLYFQDTASPQMEALTELHDSIMFYLVIILFAVGWILAAGCIKYIKAGISNKFVSHGSLVEIIWTVSPGLILIFIAFTSFKLLYLMDEVSDVNMSLYIEGHQWYWSYQYPDFLDDEGEFIEYDSYLTPESDLEPGAIRMLDVDERVILPELTHVRFIVSSGDVIHSYGSPSLGLKADAYPGRLNQASALINRLGTFYGQCSEICGILHSSMPIAIESVTLEKFLLFLWEK